MASEGLLWRDPGGPGIVSGRPFWEPQRFVIENPIFGSQIHLLSLIVTAKSGKFGRHLKSIMVDAIAKKGDTFIRDNLANINFPHHLHSFSSRALERTPFSSIRARRP
jgi:hypothetical protein